ncbi:MAG TPA: hypothetical protein VF824_04360 [Thermoanaerobaculia bacterium]|jgi:hypothetical protein
MTRVIKLCVFLLFLPLTPLSAQWSTLTTSTLYPTWYDATPCATKTLPSPIDDVIHFACPPAGYGSQTAGARFTDQIIANPHVVVNDAGEWLIIGYGENTFTDTDFTATTSDDIADAIYVFKRKTDGSYVVPTQPALQFPTGSQPLGYLGAGLGLAKTTTATTNGYRYFAIVPVFEPATNHGWLAWAVSTNGETWSFVSSSGGLTSDARASFKVIARSDLRNDGAIAIQHVAMVYDPRDGHLYLAIGYAGQFAGIKTTWWRIHFNAQTPYGLTAVTRADGTPGYAVDLLNSGTFQPSAGVIPADYFEAWVAAAQWPSSSAGYGPADPMDVIRLTNSDGSFNSMMFVYVSETAFPHDYRYVKASLPTTTNGMFVTDPGFSTPKALDFSSLLNQGYSDCGAGGGFYTGFIQGPNDAWGQPQQLFGYVGTWHADRSYPRSSPDCGGQWQGLLPMKFIVQ